MSSEHDITRRMLLTALASLPLVSVTTASAAVLGKDARRGSSTLVAYFSRTGNTQVIAGLIHRNLSTDLFEIIPENPYPEDYLATVEQASQERNSGFKPVLRGKVSGMADYQILYLGFPIWGTSVPPVIRSFLSAYDMNGKTIIPFITHGGYGPGDSQSVIAQLAPKAEIKDPFVMQTNSERQMMEKVESWLKVGT
ncbi:flavodoxin [Yersinia aleksiciae]|uniref:flavodoxin n=1 Tax=Yersinia aleksiciae TaxID=263819 RepID=UPI0011A0342C|nr:flavodoxin [Yersinia aleksiciae]